MLSREQLREVARDLAPMLLEEMRTWRSDEYLRGTEAIAAFLNVTDQTVRNRKFIAHEKFRPGDTRIPIRGTEPFSRVVGGVKKLYARPIAHRADLQRYIENLPRPAAAHIHQKK